MKNAEQIRLKLIHDLQGCLKRPGMYGGEIAIMTLLGHLSFIDERESDWDKSLEDLRSIGAFRSTGVSGGFESITKQTCPGDSSAASVYALTAFHMGYLSINGKFNIERVLTKAEFDDLAGSLTDEFYSSQITNEDIQQLFGVPSLRWGTNDFYPCIYLYLDDSTQTRFCYFDCWANLTSDPETNITSGRYGPKPILRNTRLPAETFKEQFRFTQFGDNLVSSVD